MKTRVKWHVVLVLSLVVGPLSAEEWTLEQAVRTALQRSHDVRLSDLDTQKAWAQRMSALGQMGPKLGVQGKILRWDEPTEVSFGFQIPDFVKQQLGLDIPSSMHVMDQVTKDVSLTVAQPITPLLSLYAIYRVQGEAEQSSTARTYGKMQAVAYQMAEVFFGLLKLRKALETATQAKAQVEAHLRTARAFYEQGYVQKDDVLRAEVALANVEEKIEQIRAAIDVAQTSANILLGRPAHADFVPVDHCQDPPPELEMTLEAALEKAYRTRPDLREVSHAVEMARAARLAAIGAMLPTVAGVFTWSRQWGNKFQRETSYFFGVTLQWNFWEWGAQYYQVKAAERDIAKALEAEAALKDMVTLDVKRAYSQARLARFSLETARKAIVQAEESYRITTRKYEQRVATSLEVLDAESALTASKNSYYDALYSYYLAISNLKRAMGELEVDL